MFEQGDLVFAFWLNTKLYHVGTIVERGNGMYHVVFADGDQGNIPENQIKPAILDEGQKVLALWSDKRLYPGTIQKVIGFAAYIHYDDGDKGWTSFAGLAIK